MAPDAARAPASAAAWLPMVVTLAIFSAASTASASAATAAHAPKKPHIVLTIVDELGTGDVPWADPTIHAPTLRSLAEGGLRLGTMYAWQWCAPTRGALLSGRFPMHTGYTGGGMPGDGEGMDLAVPLLPGEMKRLGYKTHMLGKWHLGFRTPSHLPRSRGFDTFFGLIAGGADHYTKTLEACGGSGENCSCADHHSATLPFRVDFFDGDAPAKDLWDATTFDAYQYATRAVEIVQAHDPSEPFFLYWAPHKVHSPLQVAPEFLRWYPEDPGRKCDSTPDTCAGRGYGTAGAGCGCSLMCYCNRRIIRGMVSCVDAMVGNLTAALMANGMWEDTVFILLGDNGAPNNNAGANTVFKGMKFSHWEGGHRVPAFIGWPGVLAAVSGRWYNNTVHLVDLHATIIDLAGGVAAQPAGVKPVDGVTLVGVLNGTVPLTEPVRDELWIADDVLRHGEWKLITGGGTGPTTCMIGIGGLPVQPANDPNNLTTTCGTGRCTGKETGPDAEICAGCKCPTYNLTDPSCRPCLFNVVSDPGEVSNLASQNRELVANMTSRVVELSLGKASPVYPPSDMPAACQAMVDAGGFFVPWAAPPPPPPPPGPPIAPEELSGTYLMDGKFNITLTATAITEDTAGLGIAAGDFHVSFNGCPSCCWTHGNGTATPGASSGGVIEATADGTKCDTPRVCHGTVTGGGLPDGTIEGAGAGAEPAASSLQIVWACTCHSPPVTCGAMGTTPWVKVA